MPAPVAALAIAAVGTALQVAGGEAARKAASAQARAAYDAALANARLHEVEIHKFVSQQQSAYLNSGVTLEGSPLLVLEDTRKQGMAELQAIMQGANYQANTLRAQGRAEMTAGLAGAAMSGSQAIAAYGRLNDPNTNTAEG